MNSTLRKTGKFSAWAVVVLVALVGLFVLVLQTRFAKRILRQQIVSRVNATLDGRIDARQLNGNLLWSAQLRDVSVEDGRGNPVARIDRVSVQYSLLSLLWGRLQIDKAVVEGPTAVVRRYKDGTLNVSTIAKPQPEPPPSAPSDFVVALPSIELEDGAIFWEDRSADPSAEASAALERAMQARGEARGEAIDSFRAAAAGSSERPATALPSLGLLSGLNLRARFEMNGSEDFAGGIESLKTEVTADTLARTESLALTGVTGRWQPSRTRLSLESLALSETPLLQTLEAWAEFETSTDELGNTTIESPRGFHLDVERWSVGRRLLGIVVPEPAFKSDLGGSLRASGTTERVSVQADVQTDDGGSVEVSGTTRLKDFLPTSWRASLRLRALDTAEVVELPGPPIRGNADLWVDGSGQTVQSLSADMGLAVWDAAWGPWELDRLATRAGVADGRAALRRLIVESPYVEARGRASAGLDGAFEVHLQTRTPERAARTPPGSEVGIDRASLDVDGRGQLNLEAASPTGYLETLDLDASWDFASFRAPKTRIESTNGTLRAEMQPGPNADAPSKLSARLKAEARGVDVPGLKLARGEVDVDAAAETTLPVTDLVKLLRTVRATGSVDVQGLQAPGADIRSGSFSFDLEEGSLDPGLDYELDARIFDLHLPSVRIRRIDTDLSGGIQLETGDGTVGLGDLRARGFVGLEDARMPGLEVKRARADVDLAGRLDDLRGQADVELQTLEAGGVDFESAQVRTTAKPGGGLELFVRATPRSSPDRPFELSLDGRHSPDYLAYTLQSFQLRRGPLEWKLVAPTRLEFRDVAIRIEDLALASPPQRIAIDGVYRSAGAQALEVSTEKLDLAKLRRLVDIVAIPEIAGTVGLDVGLSGTTRAPQVTVDFDGRELSYAGQGPWKAGLKADYRPNRLRLQSLDFGTANQVLVEASAEIPLTLTLDGQTELSWQRDASVTVDVPTVQLSRLLTELRLGEVQALSGEVGGRLRIDGPLAGPAVEAKFDATDMSIQGEVAGQPVDTGPINGQASLKYRPGASQRVVFRTDITWRDDQLLVLDFQSDAPVTRWIDDIRQGRQGIDWFKRVVTQRFDLTFDLAPLDLGNIPLATLEKADAEGTLQTDIDLSGTLLSPTGEISLSLKDFGWEVYRDIFVDMQAKVTPDSVDLKTFEVEWDADELIAARGSLPLPVESLVRGKTVPKMPLDFVFELKPIPFGKLGAIDYTFTRFTGQLAAYLVADGTLRDPKIESRLALTNTNITRRPNSTVAVELGAQDDEVTIDSWVCRADSTILSGDARLPIRTDLVALAGGASPLADGEVFARLRGTDVPLDDLVPDILVQDTVSDIEGNLTADLLVQGPWDNLEPSGSLELNEGAVTLVEYGRRFRDIQLVTRLENQHLSLQQLSFEGANGTVSASGTADLAGIVPKSYEAEFRTEDFDISGFGTEMNALVTTNATARGTIESSRYELNLKTESLDVELPASQEGTTWPTSMSEDIVIVDPRQGTDEEIDASLVRTAGAVEQTQIDVSIELSRDSWIRHTSGDVNFTASIGAEVFGDTIRMTGQVDSLRGQFDFLGRSFEVPNKEGIVRFTGASPPNPVLDVEAYHPLDRAIAAEIGQATGGEPKISVRVTGRAFEPRLDLTSDPGMSETDILFVLMTGRPPSNAGVGQDEGVANQAVAAASGIFSGLLQQKLKGKLPIDMLRIETGEQGFEDSRIRVGKYITPEIFISYSYQFGATEEEAGHQTRIEYHFLPRWMIEARYGENNTGELNVFWDVY